MPGCPRCGRPLAASGPRCLYCGAALGPAVAPRAVPEAAEAPASPPRALVILDLSGIAPEALATALGVPAYDASRRAAQGGYHLHRIAPLEAARAEAERLRTRGVRTLLVPEAEVRAASGPRLVRGGNREGGELRLSLGDEETRVAPDTLLLVVRGPIAREYQTSAEVRRVRAAGLESGYRIHLHPRGDGAPLELDPGNFEFHPASARPRSSLLELGSWVEAVRADTPMDDEFRRLPPALSPSQGGGGGPLAAAEALRAPWHAAPGGVAGEVMHLKRRVVPDGGPLILDNLAQFRFYSSWRSCVERRLR